MTAAGVEEELDDWQKKAFDFYETDLKDRLVASHMGKVLAIHSESGDYEIADTHADAGMMLAKRHVRDGRIVVFRIGPPTDTDIRMAGRMLAGRKS
jgi:hypothetical protein